MAVIAPERHIGKKDRKSPEGLLRSLLSEYEKIRIRRILGCKRPPVLKQTRPLTFGCDNWLLSASLFTVVRQVKHYFSVLFAELFPF